MKFAKLVAMDLTISNHSSMRHWGLPIKGPIAKDRCVCVSGGGGGERRGAVVRDRGC